jgi:hypothetical protein
MQTSKRISKMHSSENTVELSDDIPCLFLTQDRLVQLRSEIPSAYPESIMLTTWEVLHSRAKNAMKIDLTHSVAYTGSVHTEFITAAQDTMNPMLFLSICGAVMNDQDYLRKAGAILIDWATASPLPGTMLCHPSPKKRLTSTGLTLARFLDRIVESLRILAGSVLSQADTAAIVRWIHELGKTIKASHEHWLEHHQVEGPQNHLSWHVFGMALAGMVATDSTLLRYAVADPQNIWNFHTIVNAAIYREEVEACMFRSGCNGNGEAFSFDCLARSGEIFDRYRTLSAQDEGQDKPPCGMHYCLFNLRALVYTAHLCDCNADRCLFQSAQLLWGCCDGALLQALHFYGPYFTDFPPREPGSDAGGGCCEGKQPGDGGPTQRRGIRVDESYAPYRNQRPDYENLSAFLLASHHFPEDLLLQEVMAVNVESAHPKGKHPLLHAHPLTTPVCYMVLLFASTPSSSFASSEERPLKHHA